MRQSDRLQIALKARNVKQSDLGVLLGMTQASVSYRIKNNVFKEHDIDHICKHFGVNPDWVKTGKGEMLTSDGASPSGDVEEPREKYLSSRDDLQGYIAELQAKLDEAVRREREAVDRERAATDALMKILNEKGNS